MVQWLRICLPMQGTHVRSLSGKILHALEQLSPGATNTEAHILEPVLCNKRSHRNERPHTAMKSSPVRSKWRKPSHSNEDPVQSKLTDLKKKKTKRKYSGIRQTEFESWLWQMTSGQSQASHILSPIFSLLPCRRIDSMRYCVDR